MSERERERERQVHDRSYLYTNRSDSHSKLDSKLFEPRWRSDRLACIVHCLHLSIFRLVIGSSLGNTVVVLRCDPGAPYGYIVGALR